MKLVFIFLLTVFSLSFGTKSKESVVFNSENQNNYNYFGDNNVDDEEIMEKIDELDQEVEKLKEFEVEAMEEFELLKSHIPIST